MAKFSEISKSLKGMFLSAALGLGAVGGLVTPDTAEALSNRAQQSLLPDVRIQDGTLAQVQSNRMIEQGAEQKAATFAPKLRPEGFEPTVLDEISRSMDELKVFTRHQYVPSGIRGVPGLSYDGNRHVRYEINRLQHRVDQLRDVQNFFRNQERRMDARFVRSHNAWLRDVQQEARQAQRDNRTFLEAAHQMLTRSGQAEGRYTLHPTNNSVMIYTQKSGDIGFLVLDRSRNVLNVTDPAAMDYIDQRSDQVIKQSLRTEFSDPREPERPTRQRQYFGR